MFLLVENIKSLKNKLSKQIHYLYIILYVSNKISPSTIFKKNKYLFFFLNIKIKSTLIFKGLICF